MESAQAGKLANSAEVQPVDVASGTEGQQEVDSQARRRPPHPRKKARRRPPHPRKNRRRNCWMLSEGPGKAEEQRGLGGLGRPGKGPGKAGKAEAQAGAEQWHPAEWSSPVFPGCKIWMIIGQRLHCRV